MRWIRHFDLFLLDFDGLLVDTEACHYKAYQALCQNHGKPLDWTFEKYTQVAHYSAYGLKEALSQHLQIENWEEFYAEKKAIYLSIIRQGGLTLLPGVESFLKELSFAKAKRCVATHSTKEQVEQIKVQLPILQTIPVWITREDYSDPKPAPDAYLKAIGLLANPKDRIIGFEDSMRGVLALQETSAHPVLICDAAHPQRKEEVLSHVSYFPSFDKIPPSFKGTKL